MSQGFTNENTIGGAAGGGGGGGQQITWVNTQTNTINTSTTLVITKPTGLQVDDVMVMHIHVDGGSGVSTTPPSGWTTYEETADSLPGAAQFVGLYYKVATSSDVGASNFTMTFGAARRAGGCIAAYRYCDPLTPIDASATYAEAQSTTPDPPSITTVTDGALVIVSAGLEGDGNFSPPSGYTERYDNSVTGGSPAENTQGTLADKIVDAAGVEDPGTFTSTVNDGWIAQTMALRPLQTDVDVSAIHVNVPSEISGIDEKTTLAAADLFVIEDSAASNIKKKVQSSNLPVNTHVLVSATHTASGLTTGHVLRATGATTFAFGQASHDDLGTVTANQHHNQVHTLVSSDHTASGLTTGHVLQATGATTFAFASADGLDGTAIHDNVAAEISVLTEKTTPASGDHLLIEDSAASNVKKRVQIGNLPGGSPLTTKGDIFTFSTVDARLPVGTNGQILESRSTEATGLRWVAAPSGTIPSPSADDETLFPNTAGTGWTSERFMLNVCSDEFGADPTGSSDSAAAFREAIDWLDTNRGGFGTIYVPEGHYNFTTTESVSVRSVSENVHVHVHEGIHILGAGFGSGRSQGTGDDQLAPTTIRSTSGTPYAIFLMHATGDVPDWRGASIRQLHIKDDSTNRTAVENAIVVSGGLNYAHIENVSISNIEGSTSWAIYWIRADNNQPSQYGRITDCVISRCYNGIWIDGNAPDLIMTRISALRDGLTAGNGTGVLIESNKVTFRDSEVQFFDVCVEINNASDNRGKHILLDNIHIEGDQAEASGTYASALKMTGTSGQSELPLIRGIDIGNGGTFVNWLELTQMTDCRIYNFRIRDNKWLGVQSTDAKFDVTSSTGLIDGADLTT